MLTENKYDSALHIYINIHTQKFTAEHNGQMNAYS